MIFRRTVERALRQRGYRVLRVVGTRPVVFAAFPYRFEPSNGEHSLLVAIKRHGEISLAEWQGLTNITDRVANATPTFATRADDGSVVFRQFRA